MDIRGVEKSVKRVTVTTVLVTMSLEELDELWRHFDRLQGAALLAQDRWMGPLALFLMKVRDAFGEHDDPHGDHVR